MLLHRGITVPPWVSSDRSGSRHPRGTPTTKSGGEAVQPRSRLREDRSAAGVASLVDLLEKLAKAGADARLRKVSEATFSMMKARGRASPSIRVCACNRPTSGSSPARFQSSQKPDLKKGVEGGADEDFGALPSPQPGNRQDLACGYLGDRAAHDLTGEAVQVLFHPGSGVLVGIDRRSDAGHRGTAIWLPLGATRQRGTDQLRSTCRPAGRPSHPRPWRQAPF